MRKRTCFLVLLAFGFTAVVAGAADGQKYTDMMKGADAAQPQLKLVKKEPGADKVPEVTRPMGPGERGCFIDYVVAAPGSWAGNSCDGFEDCPGNAGNEHTYEVTLPNDGLWTISLCNSSFDTYLDIGTTCCGTEIFSVDDTCGLQTEFTGNLTAGVYYVMIEGYSTNCGDYVLDITKEVVLPGDCCEENTVPGCDDPDCEACVCGFDPFCCDTLWDSFCAGESCELCSEVCDCCAPSKCEANCYTNCSGPDDWITNVTFNTINNTTIEEGCPCSYGDYQTMSTTVGLGDIHPLSVSFSSSGFTQYVSAWIDWNQDFVWDEATERYDLGSGADTTLTGDIAVPAGAALGCTSMRVVEAWNSLADDSCSDGTSYGETEDYTVCVVAEGCCAGHDTPGCIDTDCETCVCAFDSYCCTTMWDSICAGESCTDCNDVCDCCGGPSCGDGSCDEGENCLNCPEDCGACPDVAQIYNNETDFLANLVDKTPKGTDDFEEGNTPAGGLGGPLADPLVAGVPNVDLEGEGFPNGLALPNLGMNSNLLGTAAMDQVFGSGLIALGPGFLGQADTIIGANTFVESTDIFFATGEEKTAVSFDVYTNTGPDVQILVFDTANVLIGVGVVQAGLPTPTFVGIISPVPIGRINVADAADGGELVDNVTPWIPGAPELGACCFFDASCTPDLFDFQCADLNGEWNPGLTCEEAACPGWETIPTVSEWGMIALTVLLVGAAVVVMRRRAAVA